MLTEDIVMGSAGSARPEVNVVEAGSESSEDPDFEPGIVSMSSSSCMCVQGLASKATDTTNA